MAIIQTPRTPPTQTGGVFGGVTPPGGSYSRIGARIPGRQTGNSNMSFKEAYPAAVQQTGEDYDSIMGGYKSLLSSLDQPSSLSQRFTGLLDQAPLSYNPITPQTYQYKQNPLLTDALTNLQGLSQTGGYSEQDINSLRERGISPIRSVYANAMRNMDRRRTISGNNSPNFNAASAKMARELSDLISSKTNDVNAGIAQNVAQNKLAISPVFASAAAGANEEENSYGRANTDILNRAGELNSERKFNTDVANRNSYMDVLNAMKSMSDSDAARKLSALNSMTSLYGTTPALAATFGDQAARAAQIQESANARNAQTGLGLIGQSMRQPTGGVVRQVQQRRPIPNPTSQYGALPPWAYNNNILSPAGRSI